MFFLITDTLVQLAEQSGPDRFLACGVLESLELAYRKGRHFVCADDLSLLERVIALDIYAPGYKEIRNDFAFLAGIKQTFIWHTEFVSSCEKSSIDFVSHVIYLSLNGIDQFDIVRETQVLGENLSDVSFFQIILRYFKNRNGYQRTYNFFHPLLGGGQTTASVYRYECEHPLSFLVCVTDSDYKYFGASLGETASAIRKYCNDHTDKIFNAIFYHLTNAREIENLIPLPTLERFSTSFPAMGMKNKVHQLAIYEACDPNALPFFDMKLGVSLYTLEKAEKMNPVIKFTQSVVPDIEDRIKKDLDEFYKNNPGLKGDEKKDTLRSYKYVDGLGAKILSLIIEYIPEEKIVNDMINNSSPVQIGEYDRIGRLLYDWTAAFRVKQL